MWPMMAGLYGEIDTRTSTEYAAAPNLGHPRHSAGNGVQLIGSRVGGHPPDRGEDDGSGQRGGADITRFNGINTVAYIAQGADPIKKVDQSGGHRDGLPAGILLRLAHQLPAGCNGGQSVVPAN